MIHWLFRPMPWAALAGVLLQGCLIADADLDETITACELDAAEDGDGDCVAETTDNCPGIANSEQFDADQDRRGDACDLLVLVPEGHLTVNTWDGYTDHIIASLDNNTDDEVTWRARVLSTDPNHAGEFPASRVTPVNALGTIAPGARVDIVPQFYSFELEPGLYHSAVELEVLGEVRPVDVVVEVLPQDVDETYCVYDFQLTEVYVNRYQGLDEGDLELRGYTDVAGQRVVYPGVDAHTTLSEYEAAFADLDIGRIVVDAGPSATYAIDISVVEIDPEGRDQGHRTAEFALGCDRGFGETVTRRVTVEVPSETGQSALVDVTVQALPRLSH